MKAQTAKIIFTIRVCNATPHRNKAILLKDDGFYAEGFVISHNMSKSNNTYHQLRKNPNTNDPKASFVSHQLRKGKIGEKGLFGTDKFSGFIFDVQDLIEIGLMYKAKKENKPWNYYIKNACHTVESINATTTIRVKQINNKTKIRNKSRNKSNQHNK